MPTNFTWVLHANDEGIAGDKRQIGVNWVMPTNMPDMKVPLPVQGEHAFNLAGDLMWPWKMQVDGWWSCDGQSPPVKLSAESLSPVQDVAGIHALLQAELFNKSAASKNVFSRDPDDLRPGKVAPPRVRLPVCQCADSSLPHLFASLTLLPAAISHRMLGMCRSFHCVPPKGEQAYFPEFTLDIGRSEAVRFSPHQDLYNELNNHKFDEELVAVTYLATLAEGTPYADVTFRVITQKIDTPDKPDSFEATARVMSSDWIETGTRALKAVTALAPLPMLGELVEQGDLRDSLDWPDKDTATLDKILIRALGPGLLRMDGKEPVMIWERLAGASSNTGDPLLDWWRSDPKVYERLKVIYNGDATNQLKRLACLAPLYASYEKPRLGIAALGRLFASGAFSRTLTIAWLATAAVLYAEAQPDEFWKTTSFSEWYDQLDAVIGEHDLAELQSAWWHHWLNADTQREADTKEVAAITQSWINGEFKDGDLETLVTSQSAALAWLACSGQPGGNLPEKPLRQRLEALQTDLCRPGLSAPAGLSDDADLAIAVKMTNHAAGTQDKALRGFAIALAAGFNDQAQEALNWAWITKTAGRIKDINGKWKYFEDTKVKTEFEEFHDTVGATAQNGRAMAAFPYYGEALNGILRDDEDGVDADGVDGLDFVWPKPPKPEKKWMTPQLAYGLNYFALATAIGNAGKVLDKCLAQDDDRQTVKLTADLFKSPKSQPYRYLCRVAPGGTTIAPENPLLAYKMEKDSRKWAWLRGLPLEERSHVAVIRPVEVNQNRKEIWNGSSPHQLSFSLVPPNGMPKVLKRWIEADIAQRLVGGFDPKNGDSASAHLDKDALESVREKLLETLRKDSDQRQRRARHPAVRAFGVRVTFSSPANPVTVVLLPKTKIEEGYMQPASVICTASSDASSASVTGDNGDTLKIALKEGDAAKLEVWTLVPEIFFADESAPSALGRMANFKSEKNFIHQGVHYRGFAQQQHYFECAPSALKLAENVEEAMKVAKDALELVMDGKDVAARIQSGNGVPATWIKGFLVQRHEWHWTGYPLALPRMLRGSPGLYEWSEAFAGTESLRETGTVTLETKTQHKWLFGTTDLPAWVMRFRMPQQHGARFVACILRPLLRFGEWLKDTAELENRLLATGQLVAARVDWNDPCLRLAPPTLRAAVPLVRTYQAEGKEVRAGANGALLCLDEAICRTDSLALFGGVGEIIDVDLEETRINGVFEIGPNPIMHAGPESDATADSTRPGEGVAPPVVTTMTLPYCERYGKVGAPVGAKPAMDWDIVVERPFGLTFDLDRNPKVAHTALVVRPTGHGVSTYWIMAKVRLRRMLDPDEAWTADGRLPCEGNSWLLGRRPEGDDRIPFDFAIDGLDNAQFVFSVGDGDGEGMSIAAPAVPGKRRRLLCSWHRGHWSNTAEIFWGLQVRDQALDADGAQWRTVGRYSPFETFESTQKLSFKDTRPVGLFFGGTATPLRLLLSDYGEARWLTFIGMPYRHPSLANESFGMKLNDAGAIELTRSSVDRSTEHISRDLLISPVDEKHLGGTPGSERVLAEPHVFHLLLVFERINDVAVADEPNPLGRLVGVYRPERGMITAEEPYPQLRFVDYKSNSDSTLPDGAVGFLYKFQSVSHINTGNPVNPANWEELLDAMFPPHSTSEATVRWLPEYVGPIRKGQAPNGRPFKGREVHIKLDGGPEIVLGIDYLQGWVLRSRKGPKNPWPKDVRQGTWMLNGATAASGKLDIEAGGGRLLLQLDNWNSAATGRVQMFDDNGKAASSGDWTFLKNT